MREFVTDVTDPRLADYARLTDMELRTRLESGQGLFIAEGSKVISRAVAAGYPVRSVLVAERRLADLPARGEGFHGRGVRHPLRPHDRLVRRPGWAAGGRVPAARADTGPGGPIDRCGRSRSADRPADRPEDRTAARRRG